MFDFATTRKSIPRVACMALLASGLMAGLCSCDSMLEHLVGANPKNETKPAGTPPLPPSSASFMGTPFSTAYQGTDMLPPTLPVSTPADVDTGLTEDRVAHHPLAAAPLSTDHAKLAPLTDAVRSKAPGPDARFILLVLAPPANDAATLDRIYNSARASAAAALEALRDVGVGADRVEISLATNPDVGAGEMRLYQR